MFHWLPTGDESYWAHEALPQALRLGSPPAFLVQSGGLPCWQWLEQPENARGHLQPGHGGRRAHPERRDAGGRAGSRDGSQPVCALHPVALARSAPQCLPSPPPPPQDYPWSRHANSTIADIGGGLGSWLAALLERQPGMRGLLVDRASVVADAGATSSACMQAASFLALPATAAGLQACSVCPPCPHAEQHWRTHHPQLLGRVSMHAADFFASVPPADV